MTTDVGKPKIVARNAESGGSPKTAPVQASGPGPELDELLQILQHDLLEEGPPACIVDPSGDVIYANKGYEKIAAALAEADALPNQTALGVLPQNGDSSLIAVSQEHKLSIDGRTEYFRAKRRPIRGPDGTMRARATYHRSGLPCEPAGSCGPVRRQQALGALEVAR